MINAAILLMNLLTIAANGGHAIRRDALAHVAAQDERDPAPSSRPYRLPDLKELEKSKGDSNPEATPPAGGKSKEEQLADAGISTTTAHRYEQLAAPDAQFAAAAKASLVSACRLDPDACAGRSSLHGH